MKYFGTDGIRMAAELFTTEFLQKVVAGLAKYGSETVGADFRVLIGGDTRESSEWILQDLGSALESLGIEYGCVGVLPTPAINYCFYEMGFDFAIDVTASHNPYIDNGIKIFERGEKSGEKLCEKGCKIIEAIIENSEKLKKTGTSLREDLHDEAIKLYRQHLISYVGKMDFSSLRIGMDCANGATSVINKTALESLGANVVLINSDEKYGRKINANCGSTHIEELQKLVVREKLDFGVAFDGDGDRSLFVDCRGEVVDGDQVIAIVAKARSLKKVVATVMANQGLIEWAKQAGVDLEVTAVGDHNVALKMSEKNISVGGEQNGHTILPGMTGGDGLLTAMEITRIIAQSCKKLDELAKIVIRMPQIIVNIEATGEMKAKFNDGAADVLVEKYSKELSKMRGRVLVRPSGTEKLIRITMWGDDEEKISQEASALAEELKIILEEK